MAKSRKKLPIWKHFAVGEDSKFAICKICEQSISHGGHNTKTYNTANLVLHLKKPSEQYGEYEKALERGEEDKGKEKAFLRQLTMLEASNQVWKWDINDPHAQRVHRRVTEMIALDFQPFSVVDDPGFQV